MRRSPARRSLFVSLVAESLEAGDQEIEHGADERQTAFLAGESAHHLGRPLDLAKGALEQIR
jgi:hypothetical protein